MIQKVSDCPFLQGHLGKVRGAQLQGSCLRCRIWGNFLILWYSIQGFILCEFSAGRFRISVSSNNPFFGCGTFSPRLDALLTGPRIFTLHRLLVRPSVITRLVDLQAVHLPWLGTFCNLYRPSKLCEMTQAPYLVMKWRPVLWLAWARSLLWFSALSFLRTPQQSCGKKRYRFWVWYRACEPSPRRTTYTPC